MAEAGSAWSGQVFVDTPDLNSVARANADAALAVLDQVDAALVVFHRGSVAEARPADALRPFARRRALLGVVNFADQLGAEARKTLKEQVGRVLQAELGLTEPPPVFAVSALRARLGEPLDDDWQALLQSLRTLAEAGVATELRRRNAEALLGQIRARVADALRTTEEAQGEVRKALEAGLDAVRAPLAEDFRVRLGGAGRLPSPERAAPGGRPAHRAHRMGAPALRVGLGRARGRGAGLAGEPAGRAAGGGDGRGAGRGAVTRTTGLGRAHGVRGGRRPRRPRAAGARPGEGGRGRARASGGGHRAAGPSSVGVPARGGAWARLARGDRPDARRSGAGLVAVGPAPARPAGPAAAAGAGRSRGLPGRARLLGGDSGSRRVTS